MNKKIIAALHIIALTFAGCNAMATLLHGEKPEEPPVAYTVTFDGNGANGLTPVVQTVNAGTVISLPNKGGLTSEGHIFAGWSESPDGGGVIYAAGSLFTVTGNIIFYARWLDSSTPQYTVTFDSNGATGVPPISQTAYSGIVITIPNHGTLSYIGKNFGGWNTQADGSGINYVAGFLFTVTSDITLYAKWETASSLPTPAKPTITPDNRSLIVSWQSVSGATSYEVWMDTTDDLSTAARCSPDATETSVKIVGLTNGTTYYIWIRARNADDVSGFSPSASGVPEEKLITYTVNSRETFEQAINSINNSSVADDHIINVTNSFSATGVTLTSNAMKTIIIKGGNVNCVIYNAGSTALFTVPNRITLVLENNITLNGNQKDWPVVKVSLGGTLEMKAGAVITGANFAGGVQVDGGTFNMYGGTIRNNLGHYYVSSIGHGGGGVLVYNNGTFNLSDGIISDNTAVDSDGGGVCVANATFNMTGGTINGNFGQRGGGGVSVREKGAFNMSNGIIRDNTAQSDYSALGGGVYVSSTGSFTMSGGAISGNTAFVESGNRTYGGGVYVSYTGLFTKTGGTIDDTNMAYYGKVAYVSDGKIRNITAGPDDNMDSTISGSAGGWE